MPRPAAETISGALSELRVENFRCLASAQLALDRRFNVFTGGNGAGKTSLLEAIYFLGRGRSFRANDNRVLIRTGNPAAEVSGIVSGPAGPLRLGARISAAGLELRANGLVSASAADLVAAFPVQALHADIGAIIQGPPEPRRRLLDWGVFHVKQDYLAQWRQYRRALLQRNAALRDGASLPLLEAWEGELVTTGLAVDAHRRSYLEDLRGEFAKVGEEIVGRAVELRYQPGWSDGESLAAVLRDGREADRKMGYTRAGPHRADLQFELDDQQSRWRASKGQQKMLASALVLAQSTLVARRLGHPVGLVVDEPAADLDRASLRSLMGAIQRCPSQVFLAAITADGLPLES